jgi:hypothetical protein
VSPRRRRARSRNVAWESFREVPTSELLTRIVDARKVAASALAGAGGANLRMRFASRLFANNVYFVYWHDVDLPHLGRTVRLGCLRRDGSRVHRWADLQRIKDEILGPDARAVEIYPPRGQLLDDVNMYHLWAWPSDLPCPFDLTIYPEKTP